MIAPLQKPVLEAWIAESGKAGLLYKQTFPGLALEEVFQYAIDDCKKNSEKHVSFFLPH